MRPTCSLTTFGPAMTKRKRTAPKPCSSCRLIRQYLEMALDGVNRAYSAYREAQQPKKQQPRSGKPPISRRNRVKSEARQD